jgi:hypothetical protein
MDPHNDFESDPDFLERNQGALIRGKGTLS